MADVNVISFGPEAALADIQNAAETMPFFSEKKLVIVRNWLSKQGAPRKRKGEDGGALAKLIAVSARASRCNRPGLHRGRFVAGESPAVGRR